MTIMKQSFAPNVWIESLAPALEALVPRTWPTVPYERVDNFGRRHGYTRVISHEQYRALALKAQQDPEAEVAFEESHLWLDDDPTDVKAILSEHPVIRQALGDPDHGKAIQFLRPYDGFHVKLKSLACSLTKLAIKTDGRNAGQTLHRFLTLGEARELKAYEVTLFYGLKVDARLDLGEGAFLAPYDDAKALCGEFPFIHLRHLPADIELHHPLADAPKSIAALVRELTWGPAIMSTEVETENSLATHFRFTVDETCIEDPSFSYQFPTDHERLRDFLCVATGVQQASPLQYIRVDRWMEDLDPNFRFGWTSGRRWVNDWWRDNQLSPDDARTFLELIRGWRAYQGDRELLGLAIRRLAALPSRAGRFGTEDRLLDSAIALEIMYNLDAPEITYKLQTRAGYYLGSNAEERMEIFAKVSDFYRARSALVHGPRGRQRRVDFGEALSNGQRLARETLLTLLRDGWAPDWTRLVMSANEGGHSQSAPPAESQGESV